VNYRFIIEQAAFRLLLQCAPRERRFLYEVFCRLADAPFHEPDFREVLDGRELFTRFFGPFSITYSLDHAVREVRIILIFRD
jgi:hypothetical protein